MKETEGKYTALLNKAKQTEKLENQKEVKPEKMVNVGAKVPQSHRNHWAAEAKRSGRSMTDVITSALITAFGLPPDEA